MNTFSASLYRERELQTQDLCLLLEKILVCPGRNVLESKRLVRTTVNCSNDLAAGIALDKPV